MKIKKPDSSFLGPLLIFLLLLSWTPMVTACPLQCQCNSQYYVYCQDSGITDDVIGETLSRVSSSAKLLDLSTNRISRISPHLFTKLVNLRNLNIVENEISHLASNVFQNLTKLRELGLDSNKIQSLDSTTFNGLNSLKDLHLSENSLTSLPVGTFSKLSTLEKLRLQKNSLQSLEPRTFSGLKNLKTLSLNENSLKSIQGYTFSGLHSLEKLNLRHNRLSHFNKSCFKGLTKLTELDVSKNEISDMSFIFGNDFYYTITSINLSHNSISNVPDTVTTCNRNLKHLNLSHNRIHRIANYAFKSIQFETLDLSHNSLTSVDRLMFKDTPQILNLDLSNNELSDIKTTAFDSFRGTILTLNLHGNNMSFIHTGMFRGMSRLRSLDLSNNNIITIDDGSLQDMIQLEKLDLSGNKLTSMASTAVRGPMGLKHFDLTSNPIREMVGFVFDESGKKILVEVNSSVDSFTQTSAKISWPYKQGSQLYWVVTVSCVHTNSCNPPPYSTNLKSFTQHLTLNDLQSGGEYFVCVNPVFLSTDIKVTQCTHVHTEQPQSDGKTTSKGRELSSKNKGVKFHGLRPLDLQLFLVICISLFLQFRYSFGIDTLLL